MKYNTILLHSDTRESVKLCNGMNTLQNKIPKTCKPQGHHHILLSVMWKPQQCPSRYNNNWNTNTLTQVCKEEDKMQIPLHKSMSTG